MTTRPRFARLALLVVCTALAVAGCTVGLDFEPGADLSTDDTTAPDTTAPDTTDTTTGPDTTTDATATDTTEVEDVEDTCEPACGENQTCSGPPSNTCACAEGFADCDSDVTNGCEQPLDVPEYCGTCEVACAANEACSDGTCACTEGFADCDSDVTNGCETDLTTLDDCGTCGNACGNNGVCTSGTCGCTEGFADCDNDATNGCEVDLLASNDHCGACNNACGTVPGGQSACSDGGCIVDTCNATQFDADGDVTNGCELQFVGDTSLDGAGGASSNRLGLGELNGAARVWIAGTSPAVPSGFDHYVWVSDVGGGAVKSVNFNHTAIDLQRPVPMAAAGGCGVTADVDGFRLFIETVSSLSEVSPVTTCTSVCTTNPAPVVRVFVPDSPFLCGIVTVSAGKLRWDAFGGTGNGLYYPDTAPSASCAFTNANQSICKVAEHDLDASALDVFELAGNFYAVVLLNNGMGTWFADVYRFDIANARLTSVLTAGAVDTGLPIDSASPPRVAFLPSDSETPAGFVAADKRELVVMRFGTDAPSSATEETRLTLTDCVEDTVALSPHHVLVATTPCGGAGGGAVLALASAPGAPATTTTELVTLTNAADVPHDLHVDPNGFNALVQIGDAVTGYSWSIEL